MRYERVRVSAIGYELAPVVVTTEELEERVGPTLRALHVPPGQLEAMTGIYERRYWEPGYPLSEGAAAAARKALARSPVPAAALGSLVYAGVCREHFEPATACHVAAALERSGHTLAPTSAVYDLSNACLGVLNGMLELANRIELGQIRAGMVVSCESAREIVEIAIETMLAQPDMPTFSHSLATLTGGSGAVAVILSDGSFEPQTTGASLPAPPSAGERRLLCGVMRTAPRYHQLCRWGVAPVEPSDRSSTAEAAATAPSAWLRQFMSTDSVAVLQHGVALGKDTWGDFAQELQAALGADRDGERIVDRTVCHQVGSVHRETILRELGVAAEDDFVAYDALGNTGTVALPLALALADERGFVRAGQRVGLLGIGSGLNCMMLGVLW
jgi:3-oxoacyl-[acyl-carrier-protein] synthase III